MATEHRIPVTDGEEVSAVHHGAGADRWIVFCHGFRSDKSGSYEGRSRRAVEEGFDAVRFDFRGCGESGGAFADATLSARIADLRAVLDYFDPGSYVPFGSSFGGTVAFHAAAGDDRADAVVTRAPVTYGPAFEGLRGEVAAGGAYTYEDGARIDAGFLEDFDRYDFADVEAGLDCPAAIFHGGRDESVDPAGSFRAARNLGVDAVVAKYEGEGHRFSRGGERRFREQAFGWLDTVLDG